MRTSIQYETWPPMTAELVTSTPTPTVRTATIPISTPSGYTQTPTLLVTTATNLQETIHTREIVAWCLVLLLTMLILLLITTVCAHITVQNVHRKRQARRREIQAQEDELEDNPGYEASNARPSLCKVVENPCYKVNEAKRTSESESALYESIKLEHFHTYANIHSSNM